MPKTMKNNYTLYSTPLRYSVFLQKKMEMDKALKDKIEEFKPYKIDKPPLEIIKHYRKELQSIQDTMEIVQGR